MIVVNVQCRTKSDVSNIVPIKKDHNIQGSGLVFQLCPRHRWLLVIFILLAKWLPVSLITTTRQSPAAQTSHIPAVKPSGINTSQSHLPHCQAVQIHPFRPRDYSGGEDLCISRSNRFAYDWLGTVTTVPAVQLWQYDHPYSISWTYL